MADYEFAAQFTASKVGKTGLTVTVDIYRRGTVGAIATAQSATEQGGGVYVYTHTDATAASYFAVFKTADTTVDLQEIASWSIEQVPLIDASISSVVTSISGIAAAVWTYVTRTLTSTAAQTTATLTGSNLVITNRVTYSHQLSNLTIPANWEKIYLTIKASKSFADSAATLQWLVSNPAASGDDGVIVYGGSPGGSARTLGSLTIDQPNGTITIGLQDDIDLALLAGDYDYDIKCLTDDGKSQILTEALATINLAVTQAV